MCISFRNRPYLEIVEQPAKHIRFRYDSELPKKSYIVGETSTKKSHTYPSIKVRKPNFF